MLSHCGCRHAGQLREEQEICSHVVRHIGRLERGGSRSVAFAQALLPTRNTCGLPVLLGRSWTVVDYNDQRWQWTLPQAATGARLVAERKWQPRCDCGALRSHIEEELRS